LREHSEPKQDLEPIAKGWPSKQLRLASVRLHMMVLSDRENVPLADLHEGVKMSNGQGRNVGPKAIEKLFHCERAAVRCGHRRMSRVGGKPNNFAAPSYGA